MTFRRLLTRSLPVFTVLALLVELLSLRLGWLDRFFFGSSFADVQGFDYFSLPRAWVNLTHGLSAYNTFGTPYGPHATWYLSHPALAVWLGGVLSLFEPWTSYGVFVCLSILLMALAAWLLARESEDPFHRRLIYALFLAAFPTYWMLYVGNVQALLVLALASLLAGLLRFAHGRQGLGLVTAGLLLSLFTKPVVLLLLPLFLLLRETRRRTLLVLLAYAALSLAFECIPGLNPQAIPLAQVFWLGMHPSWVQANMNVYTNGMVLSAPMLDNSIHWLNLVAQSGTRMNHVDVMSLPVFLDTLLEAHTPSWIYSIPSLAVLALSVSVARVRNRKDRMALAALLTCTGPVSFFLTYNTVWEYQYTLLLPVAAVLVLLPAEFFANAMTRRVAQALAACACLPSLFFLVHAKSFTNTQLTIIRLDRVVPAALLFLTLVASLAMRLRTLHSGATASQS